MVPSGLGMSCCPGWLLEMSAVTIDTRRKSEDRGLMRGCQRRKLFLKQCKRILKTFPLPMGTKKRSAGTHVSQ
jgi:hypothetical protein